MRYLRLLLFDKGQGWLRWGFDERIWYEHLGEGLDAPEPYRVAPPLRRLAGYLRWWASVPMVMCVGVVDDVADGKTVRYRYSWEEAAPSWKDMSVLKDHERLKTLRRARRWL